MTDLKELCLRLDTLVVFRGLYDVPEFAALRDVIGYAVSGDGRKAFERYCSVVPSIYENGGSLTKLVQRLVLEDENFYILRKGEGRSTGAFADECLANELYAFQELACLPFEELSGYFGYEGFVPRYTTEPVDLSQDYALRIKSIGKFGYGIYSKYHVFVVKEGEIVPVEYPDSVKLSELSGYQRERGEVIANTLALLKGRPANNVLLYGDCGTGKSSTVKAIANEFRSEGLRLIELKKRQLHEIPNIVRTISRNPLKFIVFIDDLSFTEDDDDFAALKAILEGSVSSTADNLVIYATSNRRHLVRETFSAREGDEIHRNDTMQELLSLSERFGLRVVFSKPDKALYLSVVRDIASQYGIDKPEDELFREAEAYALARGGRSPRAAKQFVEYLKGAAVIGE